MGGEADQAERARSPGNAQDGYTARSASPGTYEAALADPDLYARDPDRFSALTKAIADARAEKEAAEERWLELAERVEALKT